jgi:hypothetical protein
MPPRLSCATVGHGRPFRSSPCPYKIYPIFDTVGFEPAAVNVVKIVPCPQDYRAPPLGMADRSGLRHAPTRFIRSLTRLGLNLRW